MNSEYNFCTLFDSNYLSRGLAMFESLTKHLPEAKLFVVTFDDIAFETLNNLKLSNLIIISLDNFEDSELRRIKQSRSKGEYCWTCTPSIILYCIKKWGLTSCTYLDADLYFFSSPKPLLEELGDHYSVSITEHKYTAKFDQTSTSGIYCVQFMTFKNNDQGLEVLQWWRERCIEWCYNRAEDGKFGDQKYLDDWTTRFEGIRVISHLGAGLAPWNIQQFSVEATPQLLVKKNDRTANAIFFHFHSLKFYHKWIFLTFYPTPPSALKHFYGEYLITLKNINSKLSSYPYDFNGTSEIKISYLAKACVKKLISKNPLFIKRTF